MKGKRCRLNKPISIPSNFFFTRMHRPKIDDNFQLISFYPQQIGNYFRKWQMMSAFTKKIFEKFWWKLKEHNKPYLSRLNAIFVISEVKMTVQVNFILNTVLYYYSFYYEIYLKSHHLLEIKSFIKFLSNDHLLNGGISKKIFVIKAFKIVSR